MNLRETENDTLCSCNVIHEDIIKTVKNALSSEEELKRVAELFKALDNSTRLTIINALILSEMCVCDLAALMQMTQPAVSHHLKVLRQSRLVKNRREGKVVYYSLDDEHVRNLFHQGMLHACENK